MAFQVSAKEQPEHGLADEAQHLKPMQPRSGLQKKQDSLASTPAVLSRPPTPALAHTADWVWFGCSQAGRQKQERKVGNATVWNCGFAKSVPKVQRKRFPQFSYGTSQRGRILVSPIATPAVLLGGGVLLRDM